MSNQQGKKLFANRLNKALADANHAISPTYIANEFNNRYDGQSISVQSANNWLLGKAIPNQDKLAVLAIWLNVSNQWLRFGDTNNSLISSSGFNSADMDYFLKFRRLTNTQKKIISDLIDELIQ